MSLNKYFIVKIGGSVLTDKRNPLDLNIRTDVLESNLQVIGEYCTKNSMSVLICNGAGNYGHTKAKLFLNEVDKLTDSEKILQLKEIHQDVVKQSDVIKDFAYKFIDEKYILGFEFGDVNFQGPKYIVSTEEKIEKFVSNSVVQPEFIVFLSDQDGIYKYFNNQELGILDLVQISSNSNQVQFQESSDATGGMQQKFEMAKKLLKFTNKIYIINGYKSDNFRNLLDSKDFIGTTFCR